MVRSEADGSAADPSRRPIETSPFIIAPDLAARPDSRATLAALHKALRDRRVAAKSESETHVAPSAAVAALVAPNQAALVVLEVWATAPSPQLVLSAARVQVAEQLHGLTLPRSYRERHIDKAFAESLRLSVIETANGRVLWADDHAVDGGGSRPGSLESALDTLLSRLPRRP